MTLPVNVIASWKKPSSTVWTSSTTRMTSWTSKQAILTSTRMTRTTWAPAKWSWKRRFVTLRCFFRQHSVLIDHLLEIFATCNNDKFVDFKPGWVDAHSVGIRAAECKVSDVFGWSRNRIFLSYCGSPIESFFTSHSQVRNLAYIEMVQFLFKHLLLKQIILAVYLAFHWLLVATKLLTVKLHSRYVEESDILPPTP